MSDPAPLPSSGGSYTRDPETGALTLADATAAVAASEDAPAEPEKTAVKGGVKSASKSTSEEG